VACAHRRFSLSIGLSFHLRPKDLPPPDLGAGAVVLGNRKRVRRKFVHFQSHLLFLSLTLLGVKQAPQPRSLTLLEWRDELRAELSSSPLRPPHFHLLLSHGNFLSSFPLE